MTLDLGARVVSDVVESGSMTGSRHTAKSGFEQMRESVRIQQKLGARTIGFLVYWTVPSQTRFDYADLEVSATVNGLREEFLPAQLRPKQFFTKAFGAVNRSKAQRQKDGWFWGKVSETETADTDPCVNLVLKEWRANEQGTDADCPTISQVRWNKNTHEFHYSCWHPAIQQLIDKYQEFQQMTAEEMRGLIKNFVKVCGIVAQTDSGGLYYIPEVHRTQLEALKAVVSEISGGNVTMLPQMMMSIEDFRQPAIEQMNAEVEDLLTQAAEMMEATKTTGGYVANTAERADKLAEKIDLVSRDLEFNANRLIDQVGTMRDQLMEYLSLNFRQETYAKGDDEGVTYRRIA